MVLLSLVIVVAVYTVSFKNKLFPFVQHVITTHLPCYNLQLAFTFMLTVKS